MQLRGWGVAAAAVALACCVLVGWPSSHAAPQEWNSASAVAHRVALAVRAQRVTMVKQEGSGGRSERTKQLEKQAQREAALAHLEAKVRRAS